MTLFRNERLKQLVLEHQQPERVLISPFGWDVLLFLCKRAEAVHSEECLPVIPDEGLDALTPPASMSVAAALEHQGPVARMSKRKRI